MPLLLETEIDTSLQLRPPLPVEPEASSLKSSHMPIAEGLWSETEGVRGAAGLCNKTLEEEVFQRRQSAVEDRLH